MYGVYRMSTFARDRKIISTLVVFRLIRAGERGPRKCACLLGESKKSHMLCLNTSGFYRRYRSIVSLTDLQYRLSLATAVVAAAAARFVFHARFGLKRSFFQTLPKPFICVPPFYPCRSASAVDEDCLCITHVDQGRLPKSVHHVDSEAQQDRWPPLEGAVQCWRRRCFIFHSGLCRVAMLRPNNHITATSSARAHRTACTRSSSNTQPSMEYVVFPLMSGRGRRERARWCPGAAGCVFKKRDAIRGSAPFGASCACCLVET